MRAAMRLALVLWLCAAFLSRASAQAVATIHLADAGQSPGSGTPEPSGEEGPSWWPFFLVSIILVISISFEMVKEHVEHHTHHPFEPILDAFLGELATLGFIGAIAFTLTYNFDSDCEGACSVMQRISMKFLVGAAQQRSDMRVRHCRLLVRWRSFAVLSGY